MSDGVYLLNRPSELTARYAVASASMVGVAYIVIVTRPKPWPTRSSAG